MDDDEPVPLNRRPNPDLVSYGPTNDDSRAFTIGLWSTEAVLLALVIAGFTVLRPLGDLVNVVTALASMVWLVSAYAIVLRGRLRRATPILMRLASAIVCAAAVASVVALASTVESSSGSGPVVTLAVVTWALIQSALAATYASAMFRRRS